MTDILADCKTLLDAASGTGKGKIGYALDTAIDYEPTVQLEAIASNTKVTVLITPGAAEWKIETKAKEMAVYTVDLGIAKKLTNTAPGSQRSQELTGLESLVEKIRALFTRQTLPTSAAHYMGSRRPFLLSVERLRNDSMFVTVLSLQWGVLA